MEPQKAGQGTLTRLVAWMVLILAVALGCVELYAWIQSPADESLVPGEWFRRLPVLAVPLSLKFLLCLMLFVGLLMVVRWAMRRPSMSTTLVETELEMKKVSWPTKQESFNAMWVVVFVTVVLTGTLAAFDGALHLILRFIF
ncbi:MAG TPA: preprotein translocase subunit SecE [Planctomycetota bacterium]|nr:preprotein translocase subunit SecE [Planctomycetota bacterium]